MEPNSEKFSRASDIAPKSPPWFSFNHGQWVPKSDAVDSYLQANGAESVFTGYDSHFRRTTTGFSIHIFRSSDYMPLLINIVMLLALTSARLI